MYKGVNVEGISSLEDEYDKIKMAVKLIAISI